MDAQTHPELQQLPADVRHNFGDGGDDVTRKGDGAAVGEATLNSETNLPAEVRPHVDESGNDVDAKKGVSGSSSGGCFRSMVFFTAVNSFMSLWMGSFSGYLSSQLASIEREFGIDDTTGGLLMTSGTIGHLVVALPLTYLARRMHRPRFLGITAMGFGFVGLFLSVPYFISDPSALTLAPQSTLNSSDASDLPTNLCNATLAASNTSGSNGYCRKTTGIVTFSGSVWLREAATAIFATGLLLQGALGAPHNPFMMTYIDDNGDKASYASHMGVYSAAAIFGPGIAYFVGSVFSKLYVTLSDTPLTPTDPRWVGAWWLGFLVFGTLTFVSGIPLLCFPRSLKEEKEDPSPEPSHLSLSTVLQNAKGLLVACKNVLSRPLFLVKILEEVTFLMGVSGLYSMEAKYVAFQFLLPQWKVNLLLGTRSMLALGLGSLVGGLLTSRFQWSPMTCLKVIFVNSLLPIAVAVVSLFLGCQQPDLLPSYSGAATGGTCSATCFCDDMEFSPVCGADNSTYFSPCHAGCSSLNSSVYGECACLSGGATTATVGVCESTCNMYIPYMVVMFLSDFTDAITSVPNIIVIMRCVSNEIKPLALGMIGFFNNIVGTMPGPVLFGGLLTSACLVLPLTCGSTGSCALYDNKALRLRFFLSVIGLRLISLLLTGLAWLLGHKLKNPFPGENTTLGESSI